MIKKSDNDSHQPGRGEAGALVLGFGGATRAAAVRVVEPGECSAGLVPRGAPALSWTGGNQGALTQKLYANTHGGTICSRQTASTGDWVSKNDRSMVF